jgi:hypothetical protein
LGNVVLEGGGGVKSENGLKTNSDKETCRRALKGLSGEMERGSKMGSNDAY